MNTSPLTPLRNEIYSSDSYFLSGEGDMISEPLISYARQMRKNQTKAEKELWLLLRNRKLNRFKFRRQHPVSQMFILDFYCSKIKLAVELDGFYHFEKTQQEYDLERTKILKHLGISVIRFTNEEVLNNSAQVLKQILGACNDYLPLSGDYLTTDPSQE